MSVQPVISTANVSANQVAEEDFYYSCLSTILILERAIFCVELELAIQAKSTDYIIQDTWLKHRFKTFRPLQNNQSFNLSIEPLGSPNVMKTSLSEENENYNLLTERKLAENSPEIIEHPNQKDIFFEIYQLIAYMISSIIQNINKKSIDNINTEKYGEISCEYYRIISDPNFSESILDLEKFQEILELAEKDENLSLILNELDSVLFRSIEKEKEQIALDFPWENSNVIELKENLQWIEMLVEHHSIASLYYKLLKNNNLMHSEENIEKIQKILDSAEKDETLSLLLNEVDSLLLQDFSDFETSHQDAECLKLAQSLQIHLESCNQITFHGSKDSGACRLITNISKLIEQLQSFRESEIFTDSCKASLDLDEKVQSLELLMKEAEVQKKRNRLQDSVRFSP